MIGLGVTPIKQTTCYVHAQISTKEMFCIAHWCTPEACSGHQAYSTYSCLFSTAETRLYQTRRVCN